MQDSLFFVKNEVLEVFVYTGLVKDTIFVLTNPGESNETIPNSLNPIATLTGNGNLMLKLEMASFT